VHLNETVDKTLMMAQRNPKCC